MRFPRIVVVAVAGLAWAAAAQEWSIANITSCALSCLVVTIPAANCSLTDTACQCKSTRLPVLTAACLIENCTMHDQLILAKVQASLCDLSHEDRTAVPIAVISSLVAVTSMLIVLRLASKVWVASSSLGTDDWIIIVALLLSFVSTYFTVTMAKQGFGKHIWDLEDGDLSRILKNFYIGENVYVLDLALTKISVLVFYLRIFPQEPFRYAAFGTLGLIIISTTIISFMTIFSCHPVAFFWDRDIRGGTCINVNAVAYANSAMSIIQDLLIVVLPLPVLAKLNMGIKKKFQVSFMFAIGSFGCVISMIRLKTLLSFGNSLDPTWDYVNAVTWTVVELAVAMICACLPAIRNILIRLYPKLLLSSIRSKSGAEAPLEPWPSNTTGSRRGNQGAQGFVELNHHGGHVEELSDMAPPKVPPKAGYSVAVHATNDGRK